MEEQTFIIEIATTDYYTTQQAVIGGANRIELCSALSEGGITPSAAMIEQCRTDFNVQLFPIIRARGGDFLYNEEEFQLMKRDALFCKSRGCDGVVIGFLQKDGRIDKKRTAAIAETVYPVEVTFHRAFDRCNDPFKGLEDIIETGCTRILTSGQQLTAPEGSSLIKELIQMADNRIIIMPGSGVRKENIKQLWQETGAAEFHSSLRSVAKSNMEYIQPHFKDAAESYTNPSLDSSEVTNLRAALYA